MRLPDGTTGQLPDRMVLRPSRARLFILSGGAVLMVAACVLDAIVVAAQNGAVVGLIGWFGAVFFALAVVIIVWQLVQPDRFGVELDLTGFTVHGLLGSARFRWDQVDEFGTVRISSQTLVGFNYHGEPEYRGRTRRRNANRRPFGFDSFLPTSLERGGESLATLMEAWRERR